MHIVLNISFPVILVLFEALIRETLQQDVGKFIGPTLCGAALAFLVGLIKPRNIAESTTDEVRSVVIGLVDYRLSVAATVLSFVFLLLWAASVIYSHKGTSLGGPANVEVHFIIGISCYIVSCIFVALRERF